MSPSGVAERSLCTSRIFVKLEDSSYATTSFKSAMQLSYYSSAVYIYFFFSELFFFHKFVFLSVSDSLGRMGSPRNGLVKDYLKGCPRILRSLQIVHQQHWSPILAPLHPLSQRVLLQGVLLL